ncbi:MAG: hypothetical protein AAF846_25470 [Chloroflexota bacterium]
MENRKNIDSDEYWKQFTFYVYEAWVIKSYPRQVWLEFFTLLEATQSGIFTSSLERDDIGLSIVSLLLVSKSEDVVHAVLKPLEHIFDVDKWSTKDTVDWSKWVSLSVSGIPDFIENSQQIGNRNTRLINRKGLI